RRGRDGAERRRDERCAERERAVGGRAEIERRAASAPGRRGAHAGGENLEIACEQLTLRQRNVGTRHGGRRTDQQAHCELVAVRSSAGVPYGTGRTVMLAPARDGVAVAPRPVENSERNVVLDPLRTGCARVDAPSPSWNATHAGWIQYATATLVGGGGGGGTDGNVPSEQAVTAAISNRTQDLDDMARLREGRSGSCRTPITDGLQRAI